METAGVKVFTSKCLYTATGTAEGNVLSQPFLGDWVGGCGEKISRGDGGCELAEF